MRKNSYITQLLTLDEVAKILKVHKETLRRWDASGRLKAIRISSRGDRRYEVDEINDYVKKMNKS